MASKPLQPSRMELYEPTLTKQTPMPNVKRPKAQPYSSPIRGIPQSGGIPTSPDSPPGPPEKQLTIRKLRKKRAGLLDVADEGRTGSVILAMVQQKASPCRDTAEDRDRTPRPKQKEAGLSIGNFVKEELFSGGTNSEHNPSTQYGPPSDATEHGHLVSVCKSSDQGLSLSNSAFSLCSDTGTEDSPIPKRRLSRSKKFLQKAMGGFHGARSKSMNMLRSDPFTKDSKESLIRMVSRKSHKAASSVSSVAPHSISPNSSFDLDFSTRVTHRRTPIPLSFYSPADRMSTDTSMVSAIEDEVLVPKISAVQEVHDSINGDENTVWVAIQLTGVYLKAPMKHWPSTAREHDRHRNDFRFSGHDSTGAGCNNLRGDDCLYDMRIDISPSVGCSIESVMGDTEEPRMIKDQEVQLLIVKIRFVDNFRKPVFSIEDRQSSEILIAELESRLSECPTDFLDVKLTYRHTALQFLEQLAHEDSSTIAHQNTKLVTEAHVSIRRRDYLAAWSPRGPDLDGSLSDIIRNHFPVVEAEDIIQRISLYSRMQHVETQTKLRKNSSWSLGGGTVIPVQGNRPSLPASSTMQDESARVAPLRFIPSSTSYIAPNDSTAIASSRELDPARKIWSEMRKHSKGTRPAISIKTSTDESSVNDGYMDLERRRICEQAIRNKRSLGADTLRSIVDDREREKERGAEEHGVNVGGWGGWGPTWW